MNYGVRFEYVYILLSMFYCCFLVIRFRLGGVIAADLHTLYYLTISLDFFILSEKLFLYFTQPFLIPHNQTYFILFYNGRHEPFAR